MDIGLIPMAAKPYHAGHHWLVEKAANEDDKVIVFVSLSDRVKKGQFPIYGKDMERVWREELEPIMPGNVELRYGGAPVGNVYKEIGQAAESGSTDTYSIYSDAVDTMRNYSEKNRIKYMDPLYSAGQVRFPAEENPEQFTRGAGGPGDAPDISGTAMRAALGAGDVDTFCAGLPAGVDAQSCINILRQEGVKEAILRSYIRALWRAA